MSLGELERRHSRLRKVEQNLQETKDGRARVQAKRAASDVNKTMRKIRRLLILRLLRRARPDASA